jgi:intergrase/recombinase
MQSIFADFFNAYGLAILYALITALAGLAARGIAKVYNKYADTAEKRAVAKTVVMATEQIYKDLHGQEKYDKALQSLLEMLAGRGIYISDLEARMLIEAAVGEFNDVFSDSVSYINTAKI